MKTLLTIVLLTLSAHATAAQCVKIIAVGGYRQAVDSDGCAKDNYARPAGDRGRARRNAARKQKDEHDKKCRGIGEAAGCDLENPAFGFFRQEHEDNEAIERERDAERLAADKSKAEARRAREDARRQADEDRREAEREERRREKKK